MTLIFPEDKILTQKVNPKTGLTFPEDKNKILFLD
jgi:hypothetical protein